MDMISLAQRCIKNPVTQLQWSFCAEIVLQNSSITDVWQGPKYVSGVGVLLRITTMWKLYAKHSSTFNNDDILHFGKTVLFFYEYIIH